jgi:3-oxoacyl-[acyl-carrier protein] reductase
VSKLQGKVALVTGGSRGIGLAVSRALVDLGVNVVATGRTGGSLSSARRALAATDPAAAVARGSIETVQADVRDHAQMATAVKTAVERFGGLDILVNNAGLGVFANVADLTVAQWSEVIDTNLTGVFNACHVAIPELKLRGGGWIINVSSLAGKNAFPGAAAYCASKAGLNAFSEALMQEVRYDGIRVSYVMPGSVETEFAGASGGADWKLAPVDVARVVVDLLNHDPRSLPSRVEIRPSRPKKRG